MGSIGNQRVSSRNNYVTFYVFGLNFENKAGSFGKKSTHTQIYFNIKNRKSELFCFGIKNRSDGTTHHYLA